MQSLHRVARHVPRDSHVLTEGLIGLISRGQMIRPAQAWPIIGAGFVAAVGLDLWIGSVLNPSLTYIATVFLAGWFIGDGVGLACALGAAALITIIHGDSFGQYNGAKDAAPLIVAWNFIVRIVVFSSCALTASALRLLLDREQWRADVDGLTGALNKAAFQRQIATLLPEVRKRSGAVVFAYIDLDGFKAVNDRHGHSAGDRVLTAFSEGAVQAIRSYDLFARIGGDEFAAFLAVNSCDDGERAVEQLHERLNSVLGGTGLGITCSMGALVAEADTIAGQDALMEAADGLDV